MNVDGPNGSDDRFAMAGGGLKFKLARNLALWP